MPKYRPVYTKIWKDKDFLDVGKDAKLLFLYFITNESITNSGIYEIPIKTISMETGIPCPTVGQLLGNGSIKNIRYDMENEIVFVVNAGKYKSGGNPVQVEKGIISEFKQTSKTFLWNFFIELNHQFKNKLSTVGQPLVNGSLPLPLPLKDSKDLTNNKPLKIEEEKNEPMQNSADAGKPVSGIKPTSKPEVRDRVEEFLIFAQKTHERERKALLMVRGIVDREKVKSLFDGGIDSKTLSFAWLEFLADEGDYFQETDAPHNIAVFHGQVETGHYLEAAVRRISSRKAHARPQPPPRALTKPREPVNPKIIGLWDQCLGKIKAQIAPESFASWFEPTYARSLESGLLTVAVPNQFSRKCLIENYRDLIEKTLHGIRDGPLLVDFCIEADRVQLDTG